MSTPTTDRGGIQQAIRALLAGGWHLDKVNDGEDNIPVHSETAAVEAITAVDEAWLHVFYLHKDGTKETGWVFFVLGNSPEEVICDYTLNLEEIDLLTHTWIED